MSPKQTCIFLTHSVCAKCENGYIFAKRNHNRLLARLCNKFRIRPTGRRRLSQRLVS